MIIYAIGDADGPLSNEIKIGLCSRKSYQQEIYNARLYRSADLAVHFASIVRGKAAGARLKTAMETKLRTACQHKKGSWWIASAQRARSILFEAVAEERISLLTEDGAKALEREALARKMEKYA